MFENARLVEDGAILEIHIPMKFKRRGGRKEIILPPGAGDDKTEKSPTALQLALARAFRWQKMLDSGEAESASELARGQGIDSSLVCRTLRLTLLAPDIVEAILDGSEPSGLSLGDLRRPIPLLWEEQRKALGVS
jgi:hypothetical protein